MKVDDRLTLIKVGWSPFIQYGWVCANRLIIDLIVVLSLIILLVVPALKVISAKLVSVVSTANFSITIVGYSFRFHIIWGAIAAYKVCDLIVRTALFQKGLFLIIGINILQAKLRFLWRYLIIVLMHDYVGQIIALHAHYFMLLFMLRYGRPPIIYHVLPLLRVQSRRTPHAPAQIRRVILGRIASVMILGDLKEG